jgi:hypothetical protein
MLRKKRIERQQNALGALGRASAFESVLQPAISILPSPCVGIFSPAEQAWKQRDSLSGPLLLIHGCRRLDGFGWRWILWRKLRNRNAVNRQKPPISTSIGLSLASLFLFPLRGPV